MSLAAYKRTVFSWQTLKKFVSSFLQILGVIALVLGVLVILFPNTLNFGYEGVIAFSGISLIGALITIIPRRKISRQLTLPDTKITVKVGDLFQEDGNLVIGMNDVFDTEKGNIIKPNSIQGQFLTKIYNDDRLRLDRDIEDALRGASYVQDNQKTQGKSKRYPIGTVATLSVGTKKYFCSAYSRMGIDLKAQSDVKRLSTSLEMLWEAIRLKGQRDKVVMAVLGSDLARIITTSHSDLIKLIVSSFILASREQPINQELVIVIHQSNLEKVNMNELDDFLQYF